MYKSCIVIDDTVNLKSLTHNNFCNLEITGLIQQRDNITKPLMPVN